LDLKSVKNRARFKDENALEPNYSLRNMEKNLPDKPNFNETFKPQLANSTHLHGWIVRMTRMIARLDRRIFHHQIAWRVRWRQHFTACKESYSSC
jgi:hypothetical protein